MIHSYIENMLRILEFALRPTIKNRIPAVLRITGPHLKMCMVHLLENDLLTYTIVGSVDKRGRGHTKTMWRKEQLITTDEGKEVVELWRELKRRLKIDGNIRYM